MKLYEAKPSDLDGIIDEMRTTEGVEVAILLDERYTPINSYSGFPVIILS